MGLFKKSQKKELDQARNKLTESVDDSLKLAEEGVRTMEDVFKKYRHFNNKSFDSFFHVCIFSSIVQSDLILLLEKFRLAKRKYEQLLIGRVIALTIIEYIDDINVLIGRDLLKELTTNKHEEFIPPFKEISKKYAVLKRDNEALLRSIRNNAIAHKSKDSVKLIKAIYDFDAEPVYLLGMEVNSLATKLNDLTTLVFYKLIDVEKARQLTGTTLR